MQHHCMMNSWSTNVTNRRSWAVANEDGLEIQNVRNSTYLIHFDPQSATISYNRLLICRSAIVIRYITWCSMPKVQSIPSVYQPPQRRQHQNTISTTTTPPRRPPSNIPQHPPTMGLEWFGCQCQEAEFGQHGAQNLFSTPPIIQAERSAEILTGVRSSSWSVGIIWDLWWFVTRGLGG